VLGIVLVGPQAVCNHMEIDACISMAHMGWVESATQVRACLGYFRMMEMPELPDSQKETDSVVHAVRSVPADMVTHSYHARMWRAYRQIDHNEEGHVVSREDAECLDAL
jgi:hypothetical protein